jgi:hypothetical protein
MRLVRSARARDSQKERWKNSLSHPEERTNVSSSFPSSNFKITRSDAPTSNVSEEKSVWHSGTGSPPKEKSPKSCHPTHHHPGNRDSRVRTERLVHSVAVVCTERVCFCQVFHFQLRRRKTFSSNEAILASLRISSTRPNSGRISGFRRKKSGR